MIKMLFPHSRMLDQLLLALYTLMVLQVAAVAGKYEGTAHFMPVGKLASPVTYYSFNLNIDLHDASVNARAFIRNIDHRIFHLENVHRDAVANNHTHELADMVKVNATFWTLLGAPSARLGKAADALTQLSGDRDKRGLFLGGLAILGSLISLGSSLFALGKVTSLQRQVAAQNRDVAVLTAATRRLISLHSEWTEADVTWKEMDVQARLYGNAMEEMASHLEQMIDGFYSMKQNRLHPALVTPEVIHTLKDRLGGYCKEHDLKPVLSFSTELFKIPISYAHGKTGWIITCHFPLVSDEKTMVRDLYYLNSAVMNGTDSLLEYSPRHRFLAIDESSQKHSVHEMAELEHCHKVDRVYLCSHHMVLYKRPLTCVAALYMSASKLAASHCPAVQLSQNHPVIQLSDTDVVVRGGEAYTMTCGTEHSEYRHPAAQEKMTIPPGCTLSSIDFQATSALTDDMESITVKHSVILPKFKVIENAARTSLGMDLQLDIGWEPEFKALDQSLEEIQTHTTDREKIFGTSASTNEIIIIVLATCFALALIAGLAWCSIAYIRGKRLRRRARRLMRPPRLPRSSQRMRKGSSMQWLADRLRRHLPEPQPDQDDRRDPRPYHIRPVDRSHTFEGHRDGIEASYSKDGPSAPVPKQHGNPFSNIRHAHGPAERRCSAAAGCRGSNSDMNDVVNVLLHNNPANRSSNSSSGNITPVDDETVPKTVNNIDNNTTTQHSRIQGPPYSSSTLALCYKRGEEGGREEGTCK
jgi:hypothetical protein